MNSRYNALSPRTTIRMTKDELHRLNVTAAKNGVHVQQVAHKLLMQYADTGTTDVHYTNPEEKFAVDVLRGDPRELSEGEILLQELIHKVYQLKQLEQKTQRAKGKNRNGALQYVG